MDSIDTYNSGYGNYVIAGADTVCSLFSNFLNKHNSFDIFDSSQFENFLHNNINRFLYSYGTGLSYATKKLPKNHNDRITKTVDFIKNTSFMKDCILYIDSGGFQIANGAVELKDLHRFVDNYIEFLNINKNKYCKAFSLDMPPGPSSSMFSSYSQMEEYNRMSYSEFAKLPKEIKDKILYIHHFRTPMMNNTWSKFLWDEDLADGYINFSVGGIVANNSTDICIPVIIYSIPLADILNYCIQKGLTSFNFHVLGGANYIDVFYHNLFTYHIKKVHNVDVNITYDSSGLFKGLAVGRFIPVFKSNGTLCKMDLRSSVLHMKFDREKTIEDVVYERINDISSHYGMKQLNRDEHPIYDEDRGTFNRNIHMYLMMSMMRLYRELEFYCRNYIQEIYPLYENGQFEDFEEKCAELASKLNDGKLTKKIKAKSCSISKSLDILTRMDRDYNAFLIQKYMANDDITSMFDDNQLVF